MLKQEARSYTHLLSVGNRYSLGLHGLQDKLAEMNHALVNISREAVGHKVYVAGDITTTGKMMDLPVISPMRWHMNKYW